MSRSEFELCMDIAGIVKVTVNILLFLLLWTFFHKDKKEKMGSAFVVVLFMINIGLDFYKNTPPGGRFLISGLLIILYSFRKEKMHCEKTVFTLTLFYGLHSVSYLISNSVYYYLNRALFELEEVKNAANLQNLYTYLFLIFAVFVALYVLLFIAMEVILCKKAIPVNDMSWYDVSFLSVLNVVGGIFANIIVKISLVKLENDVFDLFGVKEELLWKLPLIAVLLFLGELAAKEQYAEIDCYIEKLDATIEELDYKYATGNAVTDVIINDKYKSIQSNSHVAETTVKRILKRRT